MSKAMNGESLINYYCLKKKNFIVLKYGRFYRCRLHTFKKSL